MQTKEIGAYTVEAGESLTISKGDETGLDVSELSGAQTDELIEFLAEVRGRYIVEYENPNGAHETAILEGSWAAEQFTNKLASNDDVDFKDIRRGAINE